MSTRGSADVHRTDILDAGYTVVGDVLNAEQLTRCVDALEAVFAAEADIAVARQWLTDAYRVAYMLPAKHRVFLDLCRPGPLVDLAASVLGSDSVIAGFNGISMIPGGTGQALHRDHPVPTPGVPLYVHAVIPLDEFTTANGATRIVPRSQLPDRERAVVPPSDASHKPSHDEALERFVEVAAGDAVVYDAACLHGGSANSTAEPRRALHVLFARRWVQPHWDFPGSLRETDVATLDAERRRLLGFDNLPARYDHEARRSFGYGWG